MNLAVLVMLMNYFHDLASGLFFGSVVAYFVCRRVAAAELTSGSERFERRLYERFRPVVLAALAAVVLGGLPRAYFYAEYEWLPAAGRGQVPALVAKHVVLVGVTAASLYFFVLRRPRAEAAT